MSKTYKPACLTELFYFQAFDEPWKTGDEGEKHFGWYKRAPDNGNYYIEKSTGKRFD